MEKLKKNFNLIFSTDWKETGIAAVVFAVLLVIIDSFLFSLLIGLIKVVLSLVVIGLLIKTAFLIYPILKKKAEEQKFS